ncbi:hypothetical protein AB1L88_25765 [Tautonia sp. JC769]|uniref:hypothetical protein n=1 Tax=Tautonia sp. JC769 TaxID=3232135 RepID=UPI003458C0CE
MRSYFCLAALTIPLIGCSGSDSDPHVPPALPQEVSIKIVDPKDGETLRPGQTYTCKINILIPEKSELPKRVYVDFYKGAAAAGQFQSFPAKFEKIGDYHYECGIEVQTPKPQSEYTLKASAHWSKREENDPEDKIKVLIKDIK